MNVMILGSGVAGLTVAHELVERGIVVDVYDRLTAPGGKARSIVIERESQRGLPGEHGFRFFPGFYRHVIDTMRRIPLPGGGTVEDNLIDVPRGMFAQAGAPPVEVHAVGPTKLGDLVAGFRSMEGIARIVSAADLEFYGGKVWQVITSCKARRFGEYENIPWLTFIAAGTRSKEYDEWFAGAMTRTLIAASGARASSRTVGDINSQLVVGSMRPGAPSDRLLNGPTNEAWIDPWISCLEGSGRFTLHLEHTVRRFLFDVTNEGDPVLNGVEIESGGEIKTVTADAYVCALPVEVVAPLVPDDIARCSPTLSLTRTLASHVQWMTGIQIYLKRDTPIVAGHVMFVGSPWALTAVSQQQFWKKHQLSRDSDGRVNGVLSVDISDWDTPGTKGRTARECSPDEICREVLTQIRSCLSEASGVDLSDDNIDSFFIDPDVVFFDHGGTPRTNNEPLLVNEVGSWWIRPNGSTELPNLFLAGDYVKNNTDLATMEGANEAARRTVNAMIGGGLVKGPLCTVWDLHEPALLAPLRWIDARRFARGQPWRPSFPAHLRWLAAAVLRVERWLGRQSPDGVTP